MPLPFLPSAGLLTSVAALSPAPAGGTVTLAYKGHLENTAGAATTTYSAADLGAASSDRIIVVAVGMSGASNRTLNSVTVGGVSATVAVGSASADQHAEIWFAAVPTGTTGDIVLNWSGTTSRDSIDWWAITSTTQTTYSARNAANAEAAAAANSITATAVTVPSGGVGIAFVEIASDSSLVTWTQTSGSGTERSDERVGGVGSTWVSAYDTATAGSQAFTADGADAVNYKIAVIAWGP